MKEILMKNKFIQYLNLEGNILGDQGIYQLSKGLKFNNTLQDLNLSNNEITAYGVEFLKEVLCLDICSCKLSVLNISINPIGNIGVDSLTAFLKHKNNHLSALNISECHIFGTAAIRFWNSMRYTSLVSIDASKNDFSNPQVSKSIGQGLSGRIKILNLNGCKIGD